MSKAIHTTPMDFRSRHLVAALFLGDLATLVKRQNPITTRLQAIWSQVNLEAPSGALPGILGELR
jgi:hypothetical protein